MPRTLPTRPTHRQSKTATAAAAPGTPTAGPRADRRRLDRELRLARHRRCDRRGAPPDLRRSIRAAGAPPAVAGESVSRSTRQPRPAARRRSIRSQAPPCRNRYRLQPAEPWRSRTYRRPQSHVPSPSGRSATISSLPQPSVPVHRSRSVSYVTAASARSSPLSMVPPSAFAMPGTLRPRPRCRQTKSRPPDRERPAPADREGLSAGAGRCGTATTLPRAEPDPPQIKPATWPSSEKAPAGRGAGPTASPTLAGP